MPLFKRKPAATIDAEQYVTGPATAPRGTRTEEDGRVYVMTMHLQKVYVVLGDWIVAEPDGVHFYPIKDHVFRATYEPVVEVATLEEQGVEEMTPSDALLWADVAKNVTSALRSEAYAANLEAAEERLQEATNGR